MVETPVLFVTFARPDYARQTWEGIKAAKPKVLYFYSNKGRADKVGEVECNNEIRSYIKEIDWDCNLHTWFRDECVNVYDSLRGAISWLFDNEKRGVILEEDCVPTKAFFSFADQMLDKFEKETKVWCVSGDNYVEESLVANDYFFSHYHYMYGWASWADRWHRIDWDSVLVKKEIKTSDFKDLYKTKYQVRFRVRELRSLAEFVNNTKCWDYKLGYVMDCNKALTVHPKYHLVTNIGIFGEHHNSAKTSPVNKIASPESDIYTIISNPTELIADKDLDLRIFKLIQYVPFLKRVRQSLKYRIPLYFNKIVRK